jgi:hypothetical protein
MPRPRGFSPVGIYPRDKHIRIPAASEAYIRAAVWAWEVAEVRSEVADLHRCLREYVAATKKRSRAQEKRLAQAARAKAKTSPSTRRKPSIKKHSVQVEGSVSG